MNNLEENSISVQSSPTLMIHNGNSIVDAFYHINSQYQITYEYCSGIDETDYLNTISLSPLENSMFHFSMKQYGSYNKNRPLHYHDFYEIMIVLDGHVIHKIEDKDFLYNTGSACLINRNIRHTEKFIDSCKLLFLDLTADFINELFCSYRSICFDEEIAILDNEILSFIKQDIVSHNTNEYLDFYPVFQNTQYISKLHTLSEQLMNTLCFPSFGASYMMKSLICSMVEYFSLNQNYHITRITLEKHSDFLLFSRISHLIEDTNGRITRKELETLLHYSNDYISRIIKKYTGMCLFDYCMTFCMKKAAYLLSHTTDSIEFIMEQLNFTNYTHFYKLFKKTYGLTPGKYRKLYLDIS